MTYASTIAAFASNSIRRCFCHYLYTSDRRNTIGSLTTRLMWGILIVSVAIAPSLSNVRFLFGFLRLTIVNIGITSLVWGWKRRKIMTVSMTKVLCKNVFFLLINNNKK